MDERTSTIGFVGGLPHLIRTKPHNLLAYCDIENTGIKLLD